MTVVSINFNRSDVNFAATVAYQKAGQNKPLARAIDRALVMLNKGQWSFDGRHFQVLSSDETNPQTYTVLTDEPMVCSCKGRQSGYWCKHIVAARLLVRAAEYHAAGATPRLGSRSNPDLGEIDYNVDNVCAVRDAANVMLFGSV